MDIYYGYLVDDMPFVGHLNLPKFISHGFENPLFLQLSINQFDSCVLFYLSHPIDRILSAHVSLIPNHSPTCFSHGFTLKSSSYCSACWGLQTHALW